MLPIPASPGVAARSRTRRPSRRGFTVIEVIVILIIIALMLIVIIPHFYSGMRLRKARQVKDDLYELRTAIEHYALDHDKAAGYQLQFADIRKYLDPNSDLVRRDGKDLFGDGFGPFVVGSPPPVPQKTADRLSGVAGQDFWSPFPSNVASP